MSNRYRREDNEENYEEEKPNFWSNVSLFGVVLLAIIIVQSYQIHHIKQQVQNLRGIYVYDLEETLRGISVDELNREFEFKINILNEEVTSAQEKIASVKDSKLKDDFSDVYLKSLKLKRDTMIKEYTKTLQNITDKINQALADVAREKGGVAIFDKRVVVTNTPAISDITPEVIRRVQIIRPTILDN